MFRGRGNHISAATNSPLITFDSTRKEDLLPEARCKGPRILWDAVHETDARRARVAEASTHISEDGGSDCLHLMLREL